MELIAKLFGLGIVGVIGNLVLNNAGKKDVAFFLDLVILVLCAMVTIPKIDELFRTTVSTFGF